MVGIEDRRRLAMASRRAWERTPNIGADQSRAMAGWIPATPQRENGVMEESGAHRTETIHSGGGDPTPNNQATRSYRRDRCRLTAERRSVSLGILLPYLGVFFLLWLVRVWWLSPWMERLLPAWPAALLSGLVKLAVWTLPALWLIFRQGTALAIPPKRLFSFRGKWRWCGWVALAFIAYHLLGGWIRNGWIGLHPAFDPIALMGTVLLVGITEEMVFRGFLLNALLPKVGDTWALVISSLLFVVIHYPTWALQGKLLPLSNGLTNSLLIFVLGVIFGVSLQKSNTLWAPIGLHMLWNLLVLFFFGG